MSRRDNFDWDKIGEWFIRESGDMSYRQVADKAPELSCFGYQEISYELVKEVAKERLWMDKRKEYQVQRHKGIVGDYKKSYKIVTNIINSMDENDPSNARELASLGALQLKYGEAIMALNPPSTREDNVRILGRDDVLQIIRDAPEKDVDLVDMIAERTP